jgi:dihydroorotate dehydrogenase (NAD+) catalytic subunit
VPVATDPILATDLAGISLRSPVILAAGTAGYVREMGDVLDLSRVGALVTKSITVEPREGNPTWRILESTRHRAMLNAIGLANVGIERFMLEYAPAIASSPCPVFVSISEWSVEGFANVARAVQTLDAVPAVELNVSCPNVKYGCEFGSDPALLRELVAAVREALPSKRLFAKLSPTVMGVPGGIASIAHAALDARCAPAGPNRRPGVDGLCIANTIPALALDVRTRLPRLARGSGGLSGPAIHPVAVKLVSDAYLAVGKDANIPIIGVGGVTDWRDAAEFILAGATAVEMGTALFADPRAPLAVAKGLATWAREHNAANLRELIGAVRW